MNSCFINFQLTLLLEESSEPEEEYTLSSFVRHELVLQWREHVDLERQMIFFSDVRRVEFVFIPYDLLTYHDFSL